MCFPKTESGILPNHGNFGKDLKFIASAMQSENNSSSSLLYNAVAPKTALMGHSMGGGASILGAANNQAIDAVVNFAAAETNPSAIAASANVMVPTLIFSGADDCVTPEATNQDLMYDALASTCKTQVSINKGVHCNYANTNINCSLGEAFCNTSFDITRAQPQNVTFSFLKLWLQDKLHDNRVARNDFENLLQSSTQISFRHSCETLNLKESTALKDISLFPNPVHNKLNLHFSEDASGGILLVYNSIGQQVLRTKILNTETQLNVSNLRAGLLLFLLQKWSKSCR